MNNNSEDRRLAGQGDMDGQEDNPNVSEEPGLVTRSIQGLLSMGLGEFMLRAATNIFSVVAILIVIWLAHMYFRDPVARAQVNGQSSQSMTPMPPTPLQSENGLTDASSAGILRGTNIHTSVPARSRQEIIKYTVQTGDTVTGIADKYGLQGLTILAANYDVLQDDVHSLKAGQVLKILPIDGVYWPLDANVTFAQWAAVYKVKPEDVLNYPGNHLDAAEIADPRSIKPGTYLIVPHGEYPFHMPGNLTYGYNRTNPPSAQVGGSGYCTKDQITGLAVGSGGLLDYPTQAHYLSGYDFTPVHLGIDLAANLGENILAADSGVVVYAGANSYGYGNMVMIDHGAIQTLYAHLSQIFVGCGNNVSRDQPIGAAGMTGHASGPHLHFEVRTATAVVDPWDYLPPRSGAPP